MPFHPVNQGGSLLLVHSECRRTARSNDRFVARVCDSGVPIYVFPHTHCHTRVSPSDPITSPEDEAKGGTVIEIVRNDTTYEAEGVGGSTGTMVRDLQDPLVRNLLFARRQDCCICVTEGYQSVS